MSETFKPAETTIGGREQTASSASAAVDFGGQQTEAAVDEAGQAAQSNVDFAAAAVHRETETIAETVNAATDGSTKAAEQSREEMMIGMRTAADIGSRAVDIGLGGSLRMLSSAAQAMDIYRDASEKPPNVSRHCFQAP